MLPLYSESWRKDISCWVRSTMSVFRLYWYKSCAYCSNFSGDPSTRQVSRWNYGYVCQFVYCINSRRPKFNLLGGGICWKGNWALLTSKRLYSQKSQWLNNYWIGSRSGPRRWTMTWCEMGGIRSSPNMDISPSLIPPLNLEYPFISVRGNCPLDNVGHMPCRCKVHLVLSCNLTYPLEECSP